MVISGCVSGDGVGSNIDGVGPAQQGVRREMLAGGCCFSFLCLIMLRSSKNNIIKYFGDGLPNDMIGIV